MDARLGARAGRPVWTRGSGAAEVRGSGARLGASEPAPRRDDGPAWSTQTPTRLLPQPTSRLLSEPPGVLRAPYLFPNTPQDGTIEERAEVTAMSITVRPAHNFDDMATMLGPKNPESSVCWCLSWRLSSRENRELRGTDRADKVRELCARTIAPGVLAYIDDEVVGWAGVAPRAELHPIENSRKIPHVDDLAVWSIWCMRVRPGYRKQGVTGALINGAVDYATSSGAPAIESYPVDNGTRKVDQTMAFVGTRRMFERAGFTKVADTDSVSGGVPRVVMRRAVV
jgi:GNAT superfamily N-acetyltransferase